MHSPFHPVRDGTQGMALSTMRSHSTLINIVQIHPFPDTPMTILGDSSLSQVDS